MGYRKQAASRIEGLHNRIVDAITASKRKYTMGEVIAALELVKSEVIHQHLLKEYSIQIDTGVMKDQPLVFDEKGAPMIRVD